VEKPQPFHLQLKLERQRRGWSQADIAKEIGCDTKTVGRWERGEVLPRPYHQQALCQLFEKNAEELGLMQERTEPHDLSPFPLTSIPDVPPLSVTTVTVNRDETPTITEAITNEQDVTMPLREDWDEVPQAINLHGREREERELARWIADRNCRVIAIVGMGGIGKTTLAAAVTEQMRKDFEHVFWHSLQNAPSLELVLKRCLRFLVGQPPADLSGTVDDLITLLIQYLRTHRCLMVLDNVESILQAGQHAGSYREGYEMYGKLIQRMGEAQHQGCLLLTSREKLKQVIRLEGKTSPVRSLSLVGIGQTAGRELLKDKELFGSDEQWATLIERYSGNPLALQLASEPVQEVFGGDIARFLQEEVTAFGDVTDLLDQHLRRLSDGEREVMYWLAIERETVSLEKLRESMVRILPRGLLTEILDSLRRRSMIETRGSAHFTLQPVIMEYFITHLVERAVREFTGDGSGTGMAGIWASLALIQAESKDYVRESQIRFLLAPIAQQLLTLSGRQGIEQTAKDMLTIQRSRHMQQPDYVAGNLLNLLAYVQSDLRGFDFSSLMVRQAHLQNVPLPDVNFAYAHFVGTVFTSTLGNVLSVSCSPQGNLLAMGTTTGEVWLYQLPRAIPLLTCHGHTDGVWSVAFSPDGQMLASSSDDETIRVWEVRTGRCLHVLHVHTNRVRAVAFSPDGTVLASGSDDQTIRLWTLNTGGRNALRPYAVLRGHSGRIWSVVFSPDGKLLASGSTDQTIRLWNVDMDAGEYNELRPYVVLQGHSDWIRTLAFHRDGSWLASGSDDQTVRLWNVSTGQCVGTLRGHHSRVWSVAFSPDGKTIASGSEDQTIRLWGMGREGSGSSETCRQVLQGHAQGVRCVVFSVDGHVLISGGDDQTCRLWDIASGNCLNTLRGYTNRIFSIAFSPDGEMLASASENQAVCLWNVQRGTCLRSMRDGLHGGLAVAFSPSGHILASGGQDQTVRLWDVDTGHCLETLRDHTNWIRTIAFSPDGTLLASGSEDQTVRIWNVSMAQNICVLEGHTNWIRAVAFSPDGCLLASGADDQEIRIWDVKTWRCLNVLQGHTNRVRSIAFSPDRNLLASGSEDQTIRLWEVDTGRCLTLFHGHLSWLRTVAFSPDGNLLASGSEDQTIRLWEVSTGNCLRILSGHMSRVRCIAFHPDGQTLAGSSDDGTIKLWDIHTTTCLKTLINERPYERMNIAHAQGLTSAQKATLRALGAVEV
jgi:WD40 repeat protein/transcriptional regulator with XRE-family HTH domain